MNRPYVTHLGKNGFSLIVTIAMLVILTVIAVGLLSLSNISIKSSSINSAEERARANARMALKMAIAELQMLTGADTRVTAPATIINQSNPMALGVWRSWEGTDHQANGMPIVPSYASKGIPDSSGGRFLGWLVSSASTLSNQSVNDAASLISTSPTGQTIPLLARGSLGRDDPRQIHVVPNMAQNQGRFAWWISGENQKARLDQPYEPRSDTPSGWSEITQSHTVPNPEVFGMTDLLGDFEPHNPEMASTKPARKAITRQSMALVQQDNATKPQLKFHDLSTTSVGLLTNTATGGWRKDLSILTEKWNEIYTRYPGARLPLFRISPDPGATTLVPKPAVNNYEPAQSNLYPWSEYSLILGYKQPGTYYAASASWASLQSFATTYKKFTHTDGAIKSPFVWDFIAKQQATSITNSEMYNHKHVQRLHPQIARFQIILYARAIEDPARLNQTPKKHIIQFMFVPLYVLWNPYNVTLEHTISGTLLAGQSLSKAKKFLGVGWRRSLPGAMAIENKATYQNPSLVPINQYRLFTPGNFQTLDWPSNNANLKDYVLPENTAKFSSGAWRSPASDVWGLWLPEGTLTFKPGEAKIFSPQWRDDGYGFGSGNFRMKEGYDPANIIGAPFNWGQNLVATVNFWFLFRNDRFTQPYRSRTPGYGFSLSLGDGGSHFGGTAQQPSGIGDELHNITALSSGNEGNSYWPPNEIDEVGYSVGELASGPWIPIYSASFGPRMTIGTGPGTEQNRPTKGVVQNNALAAMVLSDPGSGDAKDHPANNTFDFAYHSLSLGSTITPNLSNSAGYIATGYQMGDGLSRLIMTEIPLRPMASLVELQGWNPRGNNPYPPFQMNLIGNSDATPLIPSDQVVPSRLSPSSVQNNLMHDDAYCANHLLFDDWFVSSIAPQPYTFGQDLERDIDAVYREFLTGENQLANRSYRPIPEDLGLTTDVVDERVDEIVNSPTGDGWLKVASRLEVDGLFNVNSTSVEAWKALLGHAKSIEKLPMHGTTEVGLTNTDNEHVVTRGTVATDVKAGTAPAISGAFGNASEYSGYRSLSDDQIEDLAEKIVDQVRLRGPFLSLSEFVNRRLTTDEDLAIAGALQSAINNMADDPMKFLRNKANSLSDDTMSPNDAKVRGADYEFDAASVGSSAFGAPGWIRQADILRPIAPILTVRDDTFTIRAYGDALDSTGKVVARAWCEAVVKRIRNFADGADPADKIDAPASSVNVLFGRRYEVTSFRWLNADEV